MGMTIDTSLLYESGYNKGFKDGIKGSIPKDQYEARLNADMDAILAEIQLEIEELEKPHCHNASHADGCVSKWRVEGVIQQKINELKGNNDV